jgi:hypothetical protein
VRILKRAPCIRTQYYALEARPLGKQTIGNQRLTHFRDSPEPRFLD